jgi:nitrogen regulatory protein PII
MVQKGHGEIYRGLAYTINFVPKLKIEVAVTEDMAQRAMQAIQDSAATGQIGDGKIFVLPMESAVRIRTGESDNNAL